MAGLTWLHLSDWHQKGEEFDRRVVRDELIKDIKERAKIHTSLEKVDFIVFSGDVAFSGKKEEYEAAKEYLFEPVLDAAGLDKSRLFIVPGNHDLDCDLFYLLPEDLKKPLIGDDEIKKWLDDDKKRSHMLEPFEAYNEFIKAYADGNLSGYAWSYQLLSDDKKVALLGFNSALMCGRHKDEKNEIDDKNKLILGEPQIYDTLKDNADADVLIVVMHHPFEWLTENDCAIVESRLKEGAHFILCGHQHMPKVKIDKSTEGDCIVIPAGAAYDRRKASDPRYTNAYNFVHLDFKDNKGVAYLRCWSERTNKWREDIDAHKDGRFEFPLPEGISSVLDLKEPSVHEIGEDFKETDVPISPAAEIYDLDNPVFNVPFRAKGEGMVGREDALEKVRQQLTEGKRTAIGHTAAFQGLGGLGKTQLAVEYAHCFRNEYPKGVIWINADQEIDPQLIQIAKHAKWIHPESKHSDILDIAKTRLKSRSDCLIIFDNVESREAIEPYLPEVKAEPHLLLTSRAPQKDFDPIDIYLLDDELSLTLLIKESRRDFGSLPEEEQKAAKEIARFLGGLPLAFEIAGGYLKHISGCTFKDYYTMLEENFKDAMKVEYWSSFTRHEEKNLFVTLQVSKAVLEQAPLLNDIIELLTWSGTSFMGISLMSAILDKKEVDLYHSLDLGISLRLIQKAEDEKRYDIHRLVRRVRQEQFPITDKIEWVKDVCQRLGDWFEERRQEFTNLPFFEVEIDHLKEWLEHIKPHSLHHASRLTWLQAYPPYHWGRYKESHHLVQSAFSLLEKAAELDPKLKANILNDLGTTYGSWGNLGDSLDYYKQALDIQLENLGEFHADTALSLVNVGTVYGHLGDDRKALECKQRALEIRLQLFGEQHPDTATSLASVGRTYGELGNHRKALDYEKRALKIRRQLFGDQHPDTATSFNDIGVIYNDPVGDHLEALKFYQRALEILSQLFGEQHPDTASSLKNIGRAYFELGSYIEAYNYVEKSFNIRQKLLGEQHPKTADSLDGLIRCLTKLKKFDEASDRLNEYLDQLPEDHENYKELEALKKIINKEKRKGMGAIPSGKRKKKKKK
ncbi:MAG: tetratricopeptide repeat protein [Candidatus Aminicenantes bacterium]|nr:tetratricopeptide repeat protein [Candidatus Aminicenantes bacterium]NIM78631.1 tetratricopeptide repeat protein [Candidatus Aminicenantes bacterium]NIN17878.1 tetratricopeptide repeat protein [Candidatus Aminicenantes bacterium]NIN41781.1 tetratricopeptide repeat protein [Candidatus Aminicenantes bacterium]NIN84533.1 tetratricopeptide repeat protein [Candidatus Aminicenantes bacterium]